MSDKPKPTSQNSEPTIPRIIPGPDITRSQNSADKPRNTNLSKINSHNQKNK